MNTAIIATQDDTTYDPNMTIHDHLSSQAHHKDLLSVIQLLLSAEYDST